MAERQKTRFDAKEIERYYRDASALQVARDINLTDYIGSGGTLKGRILEGAEVAKVQILYNKLVETGKISGPTIKVDGIYGLRGTGNAILRIREWVGGTYSPEDRQNKLINKQIEKSLDGHTLQEVIDKLSPVLKKTFTNSERAGFHDRMDQLERKIDSIGSNLIALQDIYAVIYNDPNFKRNIDQIGGDNAMTSGELETLRKELEEGDVSGFEKRLTEMEEQVSKLEGALGAWSVVFSIESTAGSKAASSATRSWESDDKGRSIKRETGLHMDTYLRNLGEERLLEMNEALRKGIAAYNGDNSPEATEATAKFKATKSAVDAALKDLRDR